MPKQKNEPKLDAAHAEAFCERQDAFARTMIALLSALFLLSILAGLTITLPAS